MLRTVIGASTPTRSSSGKVRWSFDSEGEESLSRSLVDEKRWKEYDASELVGGFQGRKPNAPVLIDQGSDDQFKDKYLFPERFVAACKTASFPIQLREQNGYDHSYYFIMTFLEDHFKYHKKEFDHAK